MSGLYGCFPLKHAGRVRENNKKQDNIDTSNN